MIFDARMLELLLRVAILRLGGELSVDADSEEMASIDMVVLFAESEGERAMKLTATRVDYEKAGHA